jgi:hydroxyethylthiazole kinase-like uncharacterized protein yjeF
MKKYSPGEKCVLMSREQVRSFDAWAINTLGIPGAVLMENAGRSCAELIKGHLAGAAEPKVCIFCGTGNNGGDGYVIARHLLNCGIKVAVIVVGDRSRVKGDAKLNLDILERLGQPVETLDLSANIASRVESFAADAALLVDAIFGTGLSGRLSDEYKQLITDINSLDCPVLTVDIPSGLDCDSGEPLSTAVEADYTVTLVAVKTGFTNRRAARYTGQVFVASIGVQPPD